MKQVICLWLGLMGVQALLAQQVNRFQQWTGLSEEVITAVETDAAGNRYLSGYFGNTMDLPGDTWTGVGFRDGFLLKVNAVGETEWALQLGSQFNDEAHGVGVDPEGNVTVLLNHNDTLHFQGQAIFSASLWSLISVDANGQFRWAKNPFVEVPLFWNLVDMDVNAQGEIALAGDVGFPANSPDVLTFADTSLQTAFGSNGSFVPQAWVATYDSEGNFQWAASTQAIGASGAFGFAVDINEAGEVLLGGRFSNDPVTTQDLGFGGSSLTFDLPFGGESVFVSQWSATGTLEWADALTLEASANPFGNQITFASMDWSPEGEIALSGRFEGSFVFADDTLTTPQGGLFPTQYSFVSRWGESLERKQAQAIPISGQGSPFPISSLAFGPEGSLLIGGGVTDSIQVDGVWISDPNLGLFVAELDSLGKYQWHHLIEDAGFEPLLEDATWAPTGEWLAVGAVEPPASIGDSSLTQPAGTSCCFSAILVAIEAGGATTSIEAEWMASLQVFPNPATGRCHIQASERLQQVRLLDLIGRPIPAEVSITGAEASVRTNFRGLALLQVIGESGMRNKRLLFR
ncbi:MAG: hypothetical protein AAF399_05065 [Bacteroidota bacterium]